MSSTMISMLASKKLLSISEMITDGFEMGKDTPNTSCLFSFFFQFLFSTRKKKRKKQKPGFGDQSESNEVVLSTSSKEEFDKFKLLCTPERLGNTSTPFF